MEPDIVRVALVRWGHLPAVRGLLRARAQEALVPRVLILAESLRASDSAPLSLSFPVCKVGVLVLGAGRPHVVTAAVGADDLAEEQESWAGAFPCLQCPSATAQGTTPPSLGEGLRVGFAWGGGSVEGDGA